MSKNKIIVSSCDIKYFPLLKELFLSLKRNDILNEYEFAVLDTGMSEDQLTYLRDNKILLKKLFGMCMY